jgi:hypothetical protein
VKTDRPPALSPVAAVLDAVAVLVAAHLPGRSAFDLRIRLTDGSKMKIKVKNASGAWSLKIDEYPQPGGVKPPTHSTSRPSESRRVGLRLDYSDQLKRLKSRAWANVAIRNMLDTAGRQFDHAESAGS